MENQLVFIIGSPRSGSTLLARMLGAHSAILGRPEPHLLTPLAHLGYFDKVDKAPYDAVLAAESTREFVADLPGGEQDYVDACRAYTDLLYGKMLGTAPDKSLFLDKTPAYALIHDFISRIYPDAKYVALTRHPLAIFSSYAESFFNGDYQAAHDYNPILERYVPRDRQLHPQRRGRQVPRDLRADGPGSKHPSRRHVRAHRRDQRAGRCQLRQEETGRRRTGRPDRRQEALEAVDRVAREVGI